MDDDKFTYRYSPVRDSEVDRIAAKYISVNKKADSDLERLKRLDRKAELPGTIVGIGVGLMGMVALVTGLVLLFTFDRLFAGLIVGVSGFLVAACATPISHAVTRQSREGYRDEILALSEKIKNGN